jgi:hypothetical protein
MSWLDMGEQFVSRMVASGNLNPPDSIKHRMCKAPTLPCESIRLLTRGSVFPNTKSPRIFVIDTRALL